MLTITSIHETPPANVALSYALERLVPCAEEHELAHIRDCLRERGFDVLPLKMAEALQMWSDYHNGADDVSMMLRYAEALKATMTLLPSIRGDAT
jgi:hypothetical protein